MRKKDLIHIHALFGEVTRYLMTDGTVSRETLSEYDALGTSPSSIQEAKEDHREAIMVLGSALDECLEECLDDTQPKGQKQSNNR